MCFFKVGDLTSLSDSLRTFIADQRKLYKQQIETLESVDRQRHRESVIEKRVAEFEKRALRYVCDCKNWLLSKWDGLGAYNRDRIMELEKLLSAGPRPPVSKSLQAEQYQALLRQQLDKEDPENKQNVPDLLMAMQSLQQRLGNVEQVRKK